MKHSIIRKERTYSGFLKIEMATITLPDHHNETFTRERLLREDAATVIVHNTDDDTIVLTRQFRFAVNERVNEYLLELPAGKLEPGEDPAAGAIRETAEECGYDIAPEKLELVASFYASPGYTTEKYFLYYAPVRTADRSAQGGGLATEHEFIEIVHMPRKTFIEKMELGEIEDVKTWAAAAWLKTR